VDVCDEGGDVVHERQRNGSPKRPALCGRMDGMTTLEARDVSASVPGAAGAEDAGDGVGPMELLAPVSLSVRTGAGLAVQGPNGSGKTTLLRILSGQLRATTGDVLLDGTTLEERSRVHRRAISARIGLPAFARELTVREHLRFISATWGRPGSTASDAADAILGALQIGHLGNRFVNELSSGQTQLLSLATALVRPFDVLILDEPEQRLDAHRRALVAAAIRAEIDRGAAVVIASHSADLIAAMSGATVVLEDR
jgi:ABC-2 type transport system ATP-binding protein